MSEVQRTGEATPVEPTFRRLARNAIAGFVDGEDEALYERAIVSVQAACRAAYERGLRREAAQPSARARAEEYVRRYFGIATRSDVEAVDTLAEMLAPRTAEAPRVPDHEVCRGVVFERKAGRCSGAWTLAGTRMTVDTLRSLYTSGMSSEGIQRLYPDLTFEQVEAATALPAQLGARWVVDPDAPLDDAERWLSERDVVLKTLADTASKAEALRLRLDALRKDVLGIATASADCGWKVYTGMAAVALEDDLKRADAPCRESPRAPKNYALRCSACGVLSPICTDEGEVVDAATDACWEVEGNNEDEQDRCPSCREQQRDSAGAETPDGGAETPTSNPLADRAAGMSATTSAPSSCAGDDLLTSRLDGIDRVLDSVMNDEIPDSVAYSRIRVLVADARAAARFTRKDGGS